MGQENLEVSIIKMELLYHFKGKQTQIMPPSSMIDLEGNVVDCVLVCSTAFHSAEHSMRYSTGFSQITRNCVEFLRIEVKDTHHPLSKAPFL